MGLSSMNSHDIKVLQKITEHAQKVMSYASRYDQMDEFLKDEMCVEACVFNIMQIGELAHNELSAETKNVLSNIPWKSIYGLRNRIVHGYESVRMIVIWEIATNNIKPLVDAIIQFISLAEHS